MSKEKKKKKSHYGKVLGFCAVVVCAAALLAIFGDGIGFGGGGGGLFPGRGPGGSNGDGNGDGNGGDGSGYVQTYNEPPQDNNGNGTGENGNGNGNGAENGVPDMPVLTITVRVDSIYHGDEPVDIDDLEDLLLALHQPGFEWELLDDNAIYGTIQNVRTIMNNNGIDFVERLG